MKQPTQKKDKPEESSNTADVPPAVLLEKALLACMLTPSVAGLHGGSAGRDDDTTEANTGNCPSEKQNVVVRRSALVSSSTPLELEEAVLACMPGAYEISAGPSDTTTTTGAEYVDPLHVILEEEERPSVSAGTTVDIESEEQQQPTQTDVVSAYRVAEEEPAIIATPFKDNRFRIVISAVLVTAAFVTLIVGLSVGLTDKDKEGQINNSLGRLVSSLNVTEEGTLLVSFLKADRYIRTESGKEISTTIGSSELNWCEVVPCIQGGCSIPFFEKVYEPGCCLGDDCSPSEKCGHWCPRRPDLCHPSLEGCRDAACYECERGPSGEELYRFRDASFDLNCLRTGVATGFNDKDENIVRIYKWAIVCGFNVQGGNEWLNFGPGEYLCMAVRSGDGITKTISQLVPCQILQLGECGCAPDDVHTLGLVPPPEKPCKTKQDCQYLCGDAGEEEAKTLCDAFPGIEWWEGDNPLYQYLFHEPEGLFFGNLTIEIDIYGE